MAMAVPARGVVRLSEFREHPIPLRPRGAATPPRKARKAALKALPAAFVSDLAADWERHGPQALAFLRQHDPATYVRVVGSLVQHLVPRAAPQELLPPLPPPDPFGGAFLTPPADPMATRLTTALQALLPRRAADFSDAELVERWGAELADYYFTKVRVRRPE
jgi:hypothetical protein